MDLFSKPDDKITLDLSPSKADFYPNFLTKKQADFLFDNLFRKNSVEARDDKFYGEKLAQFLGLRIGIQRKIKNISIQALKFYQFHTPR